MRSIYDAPPPMDATDAQVAKLAEMPVITGYVQFRYRKGERCGQLVIYPADDTGARIGTPMMAVNIDRDQVTCLPQRMITALRDAWWHEDGPTDLTATEVELQRERRLRIPRWLGQWKRNERK